MDVSGHAVNVSEEPESDQILPVRQVRLPFIALFGGSIPHVMLLVRRLCLRRHRRVWLRLPLLPVGGSPDSLAANFLVFLLLLDIPDTATGPVRV